ncbi:11560_t:CDS:2 [Ambispora gerdemannii]|uniref:11560_t:CDS:1 n=1 Tax=Ambispora gerdemannii TaxID=144530 RepID=A0A9N8VAQ1_9GLOM|nr:11560_t:CDS:2 [Ambispora gerdemannii]
MPDRESSIYIHDYVRPEKSEIDLRRETIVSTRTNNTSSPPRHRYTPPKIGNPTPLGLSAFALSVMVLSFYDCHAFGIHIPNAAVGVSLFTGGVVQFAAGMWEFKVGNTFGGTGFSAFGGFWASFGVLYLDSFGIKQSFQESDGNLDGYNNALGIYGAAWTIFTFIFTLACLRTNMGVLSAFVFLTGDFFFYTLFQFTQVALFGIISGILGLICSSIVWYCFAAVLLTPDLSPISLPLWDLSRKHN